MKKIRSIIAVVLVSVISFFTLSFNDGYFEISKNLEIFTNLYKELHVYYVDETNPGELMKSGIDAMLKTLDPYTNYIPESDIEDYRFMTTGQYGGIGSLISTRDSMVIISEPYENSPAQKADLRAGDKIIEIDGKSTVGKRTDEISKILKGEPGTDVKLTIERPGVNQPLVKVLTREKIKIEDVPYFGIVGSSTGYIKLNSFTETASKDVKSAFKDLKENKGATSLILDLRGNGGGLLREAVNIVNLFVDKGQEVVFTKGKRKEMDMSYKTLNEPYDTEIPLVVLIDEGSASASEIVSGTIQDLDRGIVIGQNSFGKGLVQQTKDLGYNSKLKVTVAKYYTPSGRCIQKLDYANKDERGKATEVPDSLMTEYQTKNGRPVHDGDGISPDIELEPITAAPLTQSLVQKYIIFDYATIYRQKHDSIVKPERFALSDEDYQDFLKYIEDKEYDYTTRSEVYLERLEKVSEEEEYFPHIEAEIKALSDKISLQKDRDVEKYKEDIVFILENEIVSRYFYQTGRIKASLASDKEIEKSLEVLEDAKQYASILKTTLTPEKN